MAMKRYPAREIIGILFLFLGISAIVASYFTVGASAMLWFSNISLMVVGAGMLARKGHLIAAQLNIILVPYIVWNIDFFYRLLTSRTLWGITDYFFTERPLLYQLISIEHVFMLPIAFWALHELKIRRNDFWKISAFEVTAVFAILRLIGNEEANINCVFNNCLPFVIPGTQYWMAWIIAYAIMILMTNHMLIHARSFSQRR